MFLPLIPEGNMLIFHFYTFSLMGKDLINYFEIYSGKVELNKIPISFR